MTKIYRIKKHFHDEKNIQVGKNFHDEYYIEQKKIAIQDEKRFSIENKIIGLKKHLRDEKKNS